MPIRLTLHRTTELAATTPAIVVSPGYRLIPEAAGGDLPDEISDFWAWLHSLAFPAVVAAAHASIASDTGRVAVVGESAGGSLLYAICPLLQRRRAHQRGPDGVFGYPPRY